jgi:lysine 6-dehydrogenase
MANYLVLGAGGMGSEIARDRLKYEDESNVIVADQNWVALEFLKERIDNLGSRLMTVCSRSPLDVMMEYCNNFDLVYSCLPYNYNVAVARKAIELGKHMCDLGGNNSVVDEEFALDDLAKEHKVRIFPDCGIAPGAMSIVAKEGIEELGGVDNIDSVKMYCGGLSKDPKGFLQYMRVFSVHGLVNEYHEPVEVLRNGKVEEVEPLTGLECVDFLSENLWATYTSGGSSRMTKLYEGKINTLFYKTLRYNKEHWTFMHGLRELGFFDIGAREVTERIIEKSISYEGNDLILAKWQFTSKDGRNLEYYLEIEGDSKRTAMQAVTSDSASIVGELAVNGSIEEYGVLPQESVPTKEFLRKWDKRGIYIFEK